MKINICDVLTIDNKKYIVSYILNFEGTTYYYITNLEKKELNFIFEKNNEFFQVEDQNIINKLFIEIAKNVNENDFKDL